MQRALAFECCLGHNQEYPAATAYGAHLLRADDKRAVELPYRPRLADPPGTTTLLQAKLEALERRVGPYNPALVGPLASLGAAYAQHGDFSRALPEYRRALQILRIERGLHTPDQIPLLEQLVEIHLAADDFASADQQRAYVFDVQRRQFGDDQAQRLSAAQDFGRWLRSVYLADIDNDERYARLMQLRGLYADMDAEVAARSGEGSRQRLPFLWSLVTTDYLLSVAAPLSKYAADRPNVDLQVLNRFHHLKKRNFGYGTGVDTINTILAVLDSQQPGADPERAQAMLALADWYQWYGRPALAIAMYEHACALLSEAVASQSHQPCQAAAPIELPLLTVFHPGIFGLRVNRHAESRVRFRVSRTGRSSAIEVLSSTGDEEARVQTRKFVHDARFRPALHDGKIVNQAIVERDYRILY